MLRKGVIKVYTLVRAISSAFTGARVTTSSLVRICPEMIEGVRTRFEPLRLQLITRKLTGYFSNCLSMINSKTFVQKA